MTSLPNLGTIFADDNLGEFALQDANPFTYNSSPFDNPATALPTVAAPTTLAQQPVAPTTNVVTPPPPSSSSPGDVSTAKNWLQKAIFGIDLEDGLFIIVGLLLVAAGLYGFDTVRETVQAGVEAAAA